jgi:hypothetical protein
VKRQQKLQELLKKGYAMVYGQCLQEVRDKLESVDNWDRIQQEQSLHELITKIEKYASVSTTTSTSRRCSTLYSC